MLRGNEIRPLIESAVENESFSCIGSCALKMLNSRFLIVCIIGISVWLAASKDFLREL